MVTVITPYSIVTCSEIEERITEHTTQTAMNELLPQWQAAARYDDALFEEAKAALLDLQHYLDITTKSQS